MNKIHQLTLDYFRAPADYFWTWDDTHTWVETREGDTIIYREDLVNLLAQMTDSGFPRLGAILLILYACRQDWNTHPLKKASLWPQFDHPDPSFRITAEMGEVESWLDGVGPLLGLISSLPQNLRTGKARLLVIEDLLSSSTHRLSPEESTQVLETFMRGELDNVIFQNGPKITYTWLERDLQDLREEGTFLTLEMLEMRLRTGLSQLPKAPEIPWPEPPPVDLLTQLSEDDRTEGLARLTRRVIAALHIPLHARGASDQSYGGVSDITNRGNFDRLLISELAYDDSTLLARLANNEALYLRREEPPSPLNRERTVLVDTTLKMWGLPRAFAISSALACSLNNPHELPLHTFALGSKAAKPIDLKAIEGVIEALEELDPGLHCGNALAQFMDSQKALTPQEVIFITGISFLRSPEFQQQLIALKRKPNYLIGVDRSGQMLFYEVVEGRRKQLRTARFDLDQLLFDPSGNLPQDYTPPAIYQEEPFPLFLPTVDMHNLTGRAWHVQDLGVIGITTTGRVLWWKDKQHGAVEFLETIPEGTYHFGPGKLFQDNLTPNELFLIVQNDEKKLLRLFVLHFDMGGAYDPPYSEWDLFEALGVPERILIKKGSIYVRCPDEKNWLWVDAAAIRYGEPEILVIDDIISAPSNEIDFSYGYPRIKNIINPGYSVLKRIQRIWISESGLFHLDNRSLQVFNSVMKFKPTEGHPHSPARKVKVEAELQQPESPADHRKDPLAFTRFFFPDGSTATLDPRGMLHLKSSNPELPEFTLILVLEKAIAGWATDGKVGGRNYFVGKAAPGNKLTGWRFHQQYIKPFIQHLIS